MAEKEVLIEVKDLKKYFKVGKNAVLKAVDGVNFKIYKGETLGLVGESGCGKTTCGKTVMGLYDATDGQVIFDGTDIHSLNKQEKKEFTKRAQIIFQDPYSSLDPRMTVADIIGEGIDIHGLYKGEERMAKIHELLELVGLNKEHALRFPHEFSGGQRQRIGLARALTLNPQFIVCDEPVSALDVSIQSQVLNLMKDLQEKYQLSYLFISHDLSVVKYISDRIAVMYLGHIVETAESQELFDHKLHPYTQALVSALPIPDPHADKKRVILTGDVPNPANPPSGCTFHKRCNQCMDICSKVAPEMKEVRPGHFVACHLYDDTPAVSAE